MHYFPKTLGSHLSGCYAARKRISRGSGSTAFQRSSTRRIPAEGRWPRTAPRAMTMIHSTTKSNPRHLENADIRGYPLNRQSRKRKFVLVGLIQFHYYRPTFVISQILVPEDWSGRSGAVILEMNHADLKKESLAVLVELNHACTIKNKNGLLSTI
jgi:hypothetical protein